MSVFFCAEIYNMIEIDFESIEFQSVDIDVEEFDGSSLKSEGEQVQKRKRKLTSKVWSHFEHLPLGPDKILKAKCKHCNSVYLADSKYGTGNLKRHLTTCLKTSYRDVGQMLLAQEAGAVTLCRGNYDSEKFRELVVSAIIMHDLPFSFVEYVGVRSIF